MFQKDHTTLSPKGSYYRNDERGKANATSRLSSPVLFPVTKNQNCVFRFWYYLLGKKKIFLNFEFKINYFLEIIFN